MTDKVSVDLSATPDKVLAALKRIQEAAKAACCLSIDEYACNSEAKV